jgi:hypothetical protein
MKYKLGQLIEFHSDVTVAIAEVWPEETDFFNAKVIRIKAGEIGLLLESNDHAYMVVRTLVGEKIVFTNAEMFRACVEKCS